MKGKSDDDELRLRPGRIRSGGARARPKTLFAEVLTAARKAGYVGKRLPTYRRGSLRRSTFGRGRGVGLRSGLLRALSATAAGASVQSLSPPTFVISGAKA